MAAGALIDTSFLITLADKNRERHEITRRYWRHFLENQILRSAKFDWQRLRPAGTERQSLKDDIKILGQAARVEAEFVITDDANSFYSYARRLKESGEVEFKVIKLEDGFDRAFFDPNGQRDFADDLTDSEE